MNGHAKVLRELREGYGLTTEDARTDDNEALLFAAENDNVMVLEELRDGYGIEESIDFPSVFD